MSTSAEAVFFTEPATSGLTYVLLVKNTSPAPYSIYSLIFDAGYNVPLTPPWALGGIQPISGPTGWSESTGYSGSYLTGQTNFQGSAAASGYIVPGEVA